MVLIALASHLRGPDSGHEWVKFNVGSVPRGFPLGSPVFPSVMQKARTIIEFPFQ